MTIAQKIKSITVPVLFNILLPVFDVFSDLRLIILLLLGGYSCRYGGYKYGLYDDFRSCQNDPTRYCTSSSTNHTVCYTVNHPAYASMLLVPFIINYIFSFTTWWRLDTNKKISFIFALLNLYAPYGEVFIFFLITSHFKCCRGIESRDKALEESKGGTKIETELREKHFIA